MLSTEPLIQGTWNDVLSHKDEIPGTQRVKVVPVLMPDEDDEEQMRLQKVFDDLIEEIDQMEFTPPEGSLPPVTQAVVDNFRRKGLIT